MKNIIFIFLIALTSQIANAQLNPVLKNKKGINILPEKGNYSFGISVDPFFNYVSNIGTGNNSPMIADFVSNQTFYGKYFITEKKAYRANFRLGVFNSKSTVDVLDLDPTSPANSKVENSISNSRFITQLGFGIEHRRGNSRLQGLYGYELRLNYTGANNQKFTYGNKLENHDSGFSRVNYNKGGGTFSIGIRGFVGAEYFIAPKISIGFDLGFGPNISYTGRRKSEKEQYDNVIKESVKEQTEVGSKTTSFNLDTDLLESKLRLNFFF